MKVWYNRRNPAVHKKAGKHSSVHLSGVVMYKLHHLLRVKKWQFTKGRTSISRSHRWPLSVVPVQIAGGVGRRWWLARSGGFQGSESVPQSPPCHFVTYLGMGHGGPSGARSAHACCFFRLWSELCAALLLRITEALQRTCHCFYSLIGYNLSCGWPCWHTPTRHPLIQELNEPG